MGRTLRFPLHRELSGEVGGVSRGVQCPGACRAGDAIQRSLAAGGGDVDATRLAGWRRRKLDCLPSDIGGARRWQSNSPPTDQPFGHPHPVLPLTRTVTCWKSTPRLLQPLVSELRRRPAAAQRPTGVCAISRFSSGMQDPQLVPALSLAPISAALFAPRCDRIADRCAADAEAGADDGSGADDALGGAARQQHAALVVGERHPPRTGASPRPSRPRHARDRRTGRPRCGPRRTMLRDKRRRRNRCIRRCRRSRLRAAMTASARGRHCRRTDSRSRR